MASPVPPPERFSKEHRRAERARVTRLGRLPGPFLSFGDRSRSHAALVWVLQWTLLLVVGLGALKVLTGQWLPRYASIVVLALALGLQSLNRAVNLRAQKRTSA